MKVVDSDANEEFFEVAAETERSQAATMVLSPGQSTGGPENRHEADQWLYVASGAGCAVVEGERHALSPGALVLIESGEAHEIRNDGGSGGEDDEEVPLRTVNVYAPPVY